MRTNLTPNQEYILELKEEAKQNPEFLDEIVKFEDQYMSVREAINQADTNSMTQVSFRTKQTGSKN